MGRLKQTTAEVQMLLNKIDELRKGIGVESEEGMDTTVYLRIGENGEYYPVVPLTDEDIDDMFAASRVFDIDFISGVNLFSWKAIGFTDEHLSGLVNGNYNDERGFTIAGQVYPYLTVEEDSTPIDEYDCEVTQYTLYSQGEFVVSILGDTGLAGYEYLIGNAGWN